ncbi:hypothetical protein M8J77_022213 [Diaphorina citri]|nr:hypothetical protein M8J77_022213 [Diaphorina citri]
MESPVGGPPKSYAEVTKCQSQSTVADSMEAIHNSVEDGSDAKGTVCDNSAIVDNKSTIVRENSSNEQFPTVDHNFPSIDDKSPTIDDKSTSFNDKTRTISNNSSIVDDKSTKIHNNFPSIHDKSKIVNENSSIDDKPTIDLNKSPKVNDKRSIVSDKSTILEDKPTIGHNVPPIQENSSTIDDKSVRGKPTIDLNNSTTVLDNVKVHDKPTTMSDNSSKLHDNSSTVNGNSVDRDKSTTVHDDSIKADDKSKIRENPPIDRDKVPSVSVRDNSRPVSNNSSPNTSLLATKSDAPNGTPSPAIVAGANSGAAGELRDYTWNRISVLVCVFVVLREFHPIESYFVKYLETLDIGYTRDVVRRSIYPVGTYSSLLLMIVTFLITDYTRYKPIVILDVIAGLLSYVLILNQPSMPVMWVQQVCIGFYHAGEVSYYSYMYSKIKDKAHYQKATGRVKASIMIGRFVSGMAGQSVVLLFDTTGYKYLVYLSILGMTAAVVWTCLLPPVQDSVYFHARQSPPSESTHLQSPPQHWTNVVTTIRTDFKTAFSQVEILKWSLWWILGMGGYILVITYNQILWSTLVKEDPENNRLMNGAMDAVFTITGAISTFTIGKVALDWNIFGELMLAIGTLLQGTLLILSHSTRSLKLAYLYYILFGCIHYTMLTIASSEIAKHLKRESFALVFGFNKFIALLSVSLFTLFIVQIENTPTRTLYFIFGVYFLSIGVTYFLAVLYRSKRVLRSLF